MRAVQYGEHGGAEVLDVVDVDRPTPERDEVLVDVAAASVNPVDVMIRSGEYGDVPLPTIPGGDAAGVVAATGADVFRFDEGDRVVVSGMDRAAAGTFTEFVTSPTEKTAQLPAAVSVEVGAALGNVGPTAWTALVELAGVQPGDRVLVHGGSGGVGHVAVQIAANAGATVVATAGTAAARDQVRALGASEVIDYDADSLGDDIRAATDGAGVDVVLDHRLGEYLDVDLDVLTHGGTIVALMGQLPAADARPFYTKEATMRALRMDGRPNRAPLLDEVLGLVERGDLAANVAATYDLSAAATAQQDCMAGGYVGKLLVKP